MGRFGDWESPGPRAEEGRVPSALGRGACTGETQGGPRLGGLGGRARPAELGG